MASPLLRFLIRRRFAVAPGTALLARLGRQAGAGQWMLAEDPLASARAASAGRGEGDAFSRRAAAVIATHVHDGRPPAGAFEALLYLVYRAPGSASVNLYAARAASLLLGRELSEPIWSGLHAAFPHDAEIFQESLRSVIRQRGEAAAGVLLDQRYPPGEDLTPEACIDRARSLDDLRRDEEALALYRRAAEAAPGDLNVQFALAQALERRGSHLGALDIFRGLPGTRASRLGRQALARLARAERYGEAGDRSDIYVPERVISRLAAEAGDVLRSSDGPVVMINANLGPGGAERQFTLTAREATARLEPGRGPQVWVRSLDDRENGDFFLPPLLESGIEVRAYASFDEPVRPRFPPADLALLPPQIRTYSERLAAAFHQARPSVVHIWQEASIASAGLAALRAGVPRIVLNLRTQPLPEKQRDLPFYRPLLRALGESERVCFTINSRRGAQGYARWLDLPEARFQIIYNGAELGEDLPGPGAEDALADFSGHPVIGTVMRFDENKRPLEWIGTAARIHEARPDTRFVMIGQGPLYEEACAERDRLGLGKVLLMPGTRNDVPWWLRRFSLFMLISRIEGLPNAAIEAQLAGCPAVVTEAGGAPEAIEPGLTGLAVPADPYDPAATAAAALSLLADEGRLDDMRRAARAFAQQRFSADHMIEETLKAYFPGRTEA